MSAIRYSSSFAPTRYFLVPPSRYDSSTKYAAYTRSDIGPSHTGSFLARIGRSGSLGLASIRLQRSGRRASGSIHFFRWHPQSSIRVRDRSALRETKDGNHGKVVPVEAHIGRNLLVRIEFGEPVGLLLVFTKVDVFDFVVQAESRRAVDTFCPFGVPAVRNWIVGMMDLCGRSKVFLVCSL